MEEKMRTRRRMANFSRRIWGRRRCCEEEEGQEEMGKEEELKCRCSYDPCLYAVSALYSSVSLYHD